MTKWIRMPGPGEFRGEGTWFKLEDLGMPESYWENVKRTGWLPVHEGDKPPEDKSPGAVRVGP